MWRISMEFSDWGRLTDYLMCHCAEYPIEHYLRFVLARCAHGKSFLDSCAQCEHGFVDDIHTFANLRNPAIWLYCEGGDVPAAFCIDAYNVAYIPARFQALVDKSKL